MEKYKICPNPNCGKHNNPKAIECAWCETDLSGIKPTDNETEKEREERAKANKDATADDNGQYIVPPNHVPNMVRICDNCGMHNAANARKCSACGEDISDITPTSSTDQATAEEKTKERKYMLDEVSGNNMFCVPEGTTVIGREQGMKEILAAKRFVSRTHAELVLRDGALYIKNLSKTNYSYVNNVRIDDDKEVELREGDEIGLGGNIADGERQADAAYFVVKVE
jgi:hypothetical protein